MSNGYRQCVRCRQHCRVRATGSGDLCLICDALNTLWQESLVEELRGRRSRRRLRGASSPPRSGDLVTGFAQPSELRGKPAFVPEIERIH